MNLLMIENPLSAYDSDLSDEELIVRIPIIKGTTPKIYLARLFGQNPVFIYNYDFIKGSYHYQNRERIIEYAWPVEDVGVYELKAKYLDRKTNTILGEEKKYFCFNGERIVFLSSKKDVPAAMKDFDGFMEKALLSNTFEQLSIFDSPAPKAV